MKPELPVTGLVVEAFAAGTGCAAVHYTDKHGEEVRTYTTEKIAQGVAGRYRREGRTVHGVYIYSAKEVASAAAKHIHK